MPGENEKARPKERRRKRRRLPFDLKKALFILPNAFTASSIFCGLYAILLAASVHDPADSSKVMYRAGLAIFFAVFFDMFDGRVARLTKTQSDFGVQMDSLADAISFGVAPAVLVYKWALQPLGTWGMFIAFSFTVCGVIRLARFNVLAARGEGSSKYFIGLSIPVAAAMLVALAIAHHFTIPTELETHKSVAALVAILCYLMVSNVRYPTFKDFRPTPQTLAISLGGFALAVIIAKWTHPSVVIVLLIGGYIFMGLAGEVVRAIKAKVSPSPTAPEPSIN